MIAALWAQDEEPDAYIARNGLKQISDEATLEGYVRRALAEHPDMVAGYHRGKATLKKALMGAAMGLSGGMANPVLLQTLMDRALDE